jgi:hypothetical protein
MDARKLPAGVKAARMDGVGVGIMTVGIACRKKVSAAAGGYRILRIAERKY